MWSLPWSPANSQGHYRVRTAPVCQTGGAAIGVAPAVQAAREPSAAAYTISELDSESESTGMVHRINTNSEHLNERKKRAWQES